MGQITNIFEGWYNVLTDNTTEEAKRRAKICFKCSFKKDNAIIETFVKDELREVKGSICGVCKCPLSAKIRSTNEKCDKDLWELPTQQSNN